jgi:hypothetical protein
MNFNLRTLHLNLFPLLILTQLLLQVSALAQNSPEIKETENEASQSANEQPDETPPAVPTAKPTAAPAIQPTTAPQKDALPTDKSAAPEQKSVDYHALTPSNVSDRLSIGLNVGLGWGKSNQQNDATDRLAAEAFASYLFPDSLWFSELNYLSLTGVNAKFDETFSAQIYSFGGGVQYSFGQSLPQKNISELKAGSSERMKIQALLLAGFSQRNAKALATGRNITTKYSGSLGIEGRYFYRVWNKVDLFTGLGARAISYIWIDAKLGAMFTF